MSERALTTETTNKSSPSGATFGVGLLIEAEIANMHTLLLDDFKQVFESRTRKPKRQKQRRPQLLAK